MGRDGRALRVIGREDAREAERAREIAVHPCCFHPVSAPWGIRADPERTYEETHKARLELCCWHATGSARIVMFGPRIEGHGPAVVFIEPEGSNSGIVTARSIPSDLPFPSAGFGSTDRREYRR